MRDSNDINVVPGILDIVLLLMPATPFLTILSSALTPTLFRPSLRISKLSLLCNCRDVCTFSYDDVLLIYIVQGTKCLIPGSANPNKYGSIYQYQAGVVVVLT